MSTTLTLPNPFESACIEWLRGCSCAEDGHPEQCKECTDAFLRSIKNIAQKKHVVFGSGLGSGLSDLIVPCSTTSATSECPTKREGPLAPTGVLSYGEHS